MAALRGDISFRYLNSSSYLLSVFRIGGIKIGREEVIMHYIDRACNKSDTMGVTSGEGTAYPFGALGINHRILVGFMLFNLDFSV